MTGQTPQPQASRQRVLIIGNPKSGQGESGLDEFIQILQEKGIEVTQRELQPEKPVSDLTEDAETFGAVVAAGGDGTVSSTAYALRYRNVPLLAYPAGTANLIAQNLDMPATPKELADILLAGHSIRVDLGEVEVQGEKSGFAMLAGAGADATMIKDSEDLKEKFGPMAYVMSVMKQLNPKKTVFHLVIDGQPREFEGIGVMVANFGMANLRLPITANINPTDGRLTVVLLKAGNIFRLLPNLVDSVRVKLNLGDPMFSDNLETIEAKTIQVDAQDPFPMQYDGELLTQTTPFSAKILPGAVRFLTAASLEDIKT